MKTHGTLIIIRVTLIRTEESPNEVECVAKCFEVTEKVFSRISEITKDGYHLLECQNSVANFKLLISEK